MKPESIKGLAVAFATLLLLTLAAPAYADRGPRQGRSPHHSISSRQQGHHGSYRGRHQGYYGHNRYRYGHHRGYYGGYRHGYYGSGYGYYPYYPVSYYNPYAYYYWPGFSFYIGF